MKINDYFTTAELENPYYIGPQNGYKRFDYEKFGEGVKHDINPYLGFDLKFGSAHIPRADLSGLPSHQSALLSEWAKGGGGLGGAAVNQIYKSNKQSPELEAAAKFNAQLDKYSLNKYTYDGLDKFYKDAFKTYGIKAKDISSLEAINKISPEKKLAVENHVAAMKQAQNQVPKSGILDSVAGKVALGLTGLINPYAAAALGAGAGAASGEGGLLNAALGAASGYGIGSTLHNGIVLPKALGGKTLLKPIVQNGVPQGVNPLDFIPGTKGTVRPDAAFGTPKAAVGTFGTPGGSSGFFFERPIVVGGSGGLLSSAGGAAGNVDRAIADPNIDFTKRAPGSVFGSGFAEQYGGGLPAGSVLPAAAPTVGATGQSFWDFLPSVSALGSAVPSLGATTGKIPLSPIKGSSPKKTKSTLSGTGKGTSSGKGKGAGSKADADLDISKKSASRDIALNQQGLLGFNAEYTPPPLPPDIITPRYFNVGTNPFNKSLFRDFFVS